MAWGISRTAIRSYHITVSVTSHGGIPQSTGDSPVITTGFLMFLERNERIYFGSQTWQNSIVTPQRIPKDRYLYTVPSFLGVSTQNLPCQGSSHRFFGHHWCLRCRDVWAPGGSMGDIFGAIGNVTLLGL